jgi:hypothetical protein
MFGSEGTQSEEPRRVKDLEEMFDVDRKRLIRQMVDNFEQALREIQSAQDDVKSYVVACREQQFSPRDIAAMKEIASLRLKDQGGAAKEKLEALNRIGKTVGYDLFDWADRQT